MPARGYRVYVCPDENGQPIWIGKLPVWWDRVGLFEKYGDRRIDTEHPIYVDYGLLLSRSEVYAWDSVCREIFAMDPRRHRADVKKSLQQRDTMLKTMKWVVVESYEWESGLD